MTPALIRQQMKRILPSFLTGILRRMEMYVGRLSALIKVIRDIKGKTPIDSRVVRRSIIFAPFLMLKNLKQWRDPYLLRDADVYSKSLGWFGVRAYSDDLIHVMYSHHEELFEVIDSIVKEGDTVIDAGANIGGVTVYMAQKVGASGKVLAVEMMPGTAKCLKRNLELNELHWVKVVENALSDKSGDFVTAQVPIGFFGQASIASSIPGDTMELETTKVPTTTIDEIASHLSDISLMKMDLEGAEPQALVGALQTLPKIHNIIYESWDGDDGMVEASLRSIGFDITPIDGRNFLASRQDQEKLPNK